MLKRSEFSQPIRRDEIPQLFIPSDIDMHSFNKHMATNWSRQTSCSTYDYQHLPVDVIQCTCIRVIIRRAVLDLCGVRRKAWWVSNTPKKMQLEWDATNCLILTETPSFIVRLAINGCLFHGFMQGISYRKARVPTRSHQNMKLAACVLSHLHLLRGVKAIPTLSQAKYALSTMQRIIISSINVANAITNITSTTTSVDTGRKRS